MAYNPNATGAKLPERTTSGNTSAIARPDFGTDVGMTGSKMELTPAAAREVARIQGKLISAKCYPRNPSQSLIKIESECGRMAVAENATYEYSRGGTLIKGPSIRIAESVARCWGNIDYGFEEMETESNRSKVRAYAIDYETNTSAERIFWVDHVRYTKSKGREALTDPRDIYEVIANNAARRVRACILEVIPGDVIDYAMDKCNETVASKINITPDSINELLSAFSKYGVTKAMIEAFIQRNIEAISTAQYIRMRNIFASFRDGMAKPDEIFDMSIKETPTAPAPASKPKTAKKTQPAPKQEPVVEAPSEEPEEELMEDPGDEEDPIASLPTEDDFESDPALDAFWSNM